jgi:hypothetical protein
MLSAVCLQCYRYAGMLHASNSLLMRVQREGAQRVQDSAHRRSAPAAGALSAALLLAAPTVPTCARLNCASNANPQNTLASTKPGVSQAAAGCQHPHITPTPAATTLTWPASSDSNNSITSLW